MRALQALVVVLGILLLAGTATVAVTIISRLGARGHQPAAATHAAAVSDSSGPTRADLVLPPDARIDTVTASGDRLLLHVSTPAGDSLLIVDPATGTILHQLDVRRMPVTAH